MYNENIDIIIPILLTRHGVPEGDRRDGYLNLLIDSIDKFTNHPYKIYVVPDVRNEEEQKLFKELQDFYKSRDDVSILKSKNTDNSHSDTRHTLKDGRVVGQCSINKSIALETGILEGKGKYICLLDSDCTFLNEWTELVLPLLKEHFFVSASFRKDHNMARDQFFIYDRERFDKENLIPDCSIGDCGGNVTKYAEKNNFEFYICKNSTHWGDRLLKKEHLLDLEGYGEQIWVDEIPFLYHYNRGSSKDDYAFKLWLKVVGDYLKNHPGKTIVNKPEQKVEVRILKSEKKYSIQEVYFNGEEPFAHSVDLMVEGKSVEELHQQLSEMISALKHPPINEITTGSKKKVIDGGKTIVSKTEKMWWDE